MNKKKKIIVININNYYDKQLNKNIYFKQEEE